MRTRFASVVAAALALGLGLAACDQDGLTSARPTPQPAPLLAALRCTATVATKQVSCAKDESTGASKYIMIGGQGVYVQLTSSNIQVVADSFKFDVTVQNLIPQSLGTTDGVTLDPNGVRIFFNTGPVATGGSGTVTVANPDGTGTFTTTGQPYYQYNELLASNQTSGAKTWALQVDPGVTSFAFTVFVAAEVRFPSGYIDVTPGADSILEGATQALTGTVRSAVGNIILDPITWGTGNAAIATVDGSGNVTGVAPGLVTITATSGVRTGSATFAVCPDLSVGEVYTAVMPAAAGICFAGGAGGNAEYTYMPVNLNTSSLSLTVTGSGIVAVTGPPTPDRIPSSPLFARSSEASDRMHLSMLERMQHETEPLLRNRASRVQRQTGRRGGASYVITPGVPTVGQLMDLNTNSSCSGSPSIRTGMVRTVSQHLIIISDTANPAGGFTTAQYDSIALEFDTIAWPADSANFGPPTDLDTNGRVVAFYTRAVNELSPPASSAVVLGFFASKDVFTSDPVNGCSNSNEGEMFYMLVPDPTGAVNSNVRTVSFVRGSTVGTLGHEFQHMINAFRRAYVTGASFFEQGFLNEGLSHVAEELMFYRTSVGLAPGGNIQLSTLTTGPNASRRVAAFNTYANQNYGRLRGWMQRPDTAGAFKPNANSLAVRGAIWAFMRYAADRTGGTQSTFWYNLVNSNLEGKPNIQNAIGGTNPDLWLRDFTAAMYADDAGTGVTAEYTQPSWNFRSVYGGLGGFPLLTRPLSNGVGLTLSYSSGGGTAYARFGVPQNAFAGVTALSGGVPPVSPYALIVTRTK